MDLAATKIAYVDGDPKNGALVTVEARDKLVMPVTLRVVFADGSKKDMRLPAETWIPQAATAVPVGGISKLVSATLDPDTTLPATDRSHTAVPGWREPVPLPKTAPR